MVSVTPWRGEGTVMPRRVSFTSEFIMALKKIVPPKISTEPVPALLEMLPGHTEQAVLKWLHEQGATKIEQLAPGFLSVTASPGTLQAAEAMARVEIKHRKTMHGIG